MHLETMDKRLISAGCVVAALICLWFAIDGVRNGVVYSPRGHGAAVPVERDQQPLEFWFNVWLYVCFSGGYCGGPGASLQCESKASLPLEIARVLKSECRY
jgi:hypothetical protein